MICLVALYYWRLSVFSPAVCNNPLAEIHWFKLKSIFHIHFHLHNYCTFVPLCFSLCIDRFIGSNILISNCGNDFQYDNEMCDLCVRLSKETTQKVPKLPPNLWNDCVSLWESYEIRLHAFNLIQCSLHDSANRKISVLAQEYRAYWTSAQR